MTLEKVIKQLTEVKTLTKEERHRCKLKMLVGEEDERREAKIQLRNHYLPYALEYAEEYGKTFPDAFKSEQDATDVVADGVIFLSSMIDEYALYSDKPFKNFFQQRLRSHMKVLKAEEKERKEVIVDLVKTLKDETISDKYYHTIKNLTERIESEIELLDPMEQKIVRCRYGFDGKEPKSAQALAKELNVSPNILRSVHNSAITRFQEHFTNDEANDMLYESKNTKKLVK